VLQVPAIQGLAERFAHIGQYICREGFGQQLDAGSDGGVNRAKFHEAFVLVVRFG
jgi:hypothetical protein